MNIIKIIVVLIAFIVVMGMVLKHLAQNKTKELFGKFADNSIEVKRIKAQHDVLKQPLLEGGKVRRKELAVLQDMARNPYKAEIARAHGEAVAGSVSAIADSELAKPIGLAAASMSGVHEANLIANAAVHGVGMLKDGRQGCPSAPHGPVPINFLEDNEL